MNNEAIASKTLNDTLNGLEPSQLLMKALQLGMRKTVEGVNYIVKQTPSGLGWRVDKVKKGKKVKRGRVKGQIEPNDLFDNENFPDLENIEVVNDLNNSSTGAKLVKDKVSGELYVMKKGASDEHVKEEFLANCIYRLFDVNVPEVKMYENGGRHFMLSKFMPETVAANNQMDEQLREDIMQDYVLDCLLANWDIHKNDNILINTDSGDFVRVDNGGSLRFSAQGRDKGKYFYDEVDELETMLENNPELQGVLEDKHIKAQMKVILKKRNEILYLIDDDNLRDKMTKRLNDLEDRLSNKPKDPYRELKERELSKALEDAGGHITGTNENGWAFLSEICKLRNFDLPPVVLDEKEFNALVKKKSTLLIHRGLTGGYNRTARDYMSDFATGEECFYGTQAMYGAGIYAAVNKTKKTPPPPNDDYEIALSYAGFNADHVMDIAVTDDVKIIDADELDEMMNEEFFGSDFKEKKKEYDTERDELNRLYTEKEQEEKVISDRVKGKLGWNEKAFRYLRRSKPEEIYADLKKGNFERAIKYFSTLVSSLNGRIDKLDELNYEVHLPNSTNTYLINKNTATRALKQKADWTIPYNYHYKQLKSFIHQNHFKIIQGEVDKAIKHQTQIDPNLKTINDNIKASEDRIKTLTDEINLLKTTGTETLNETIAEIVKHPKGTHRGFYAAIKGYDMIIQKNGWGGNTDFAVILNRSKMFVKEFK